MTIGATMVLRLCSGGAVTHGGGDGGAAFQPRVVSFREAKSASLRLTAAFALLAIVSEVERLSRFQRRQHVRVCFPKVIDQFMRTDVHWSRCAKVELAHALLEGGLVRHPIHHAGCCSVQKIVRTVDDCERIAWYLGLACSHAIGLGNQYASRLCA